MEDLVQAQPDDILQKSVLEYCIAKKNIATIENDYHGIKKETREQIRTYKEMLTEELLKSNRTCVSIIHNGQEVWIRLKPIRLPSRKISIENVIQVLKETKIDALLKMSGQIDLPNLLSQLIHNEFSSKQSDKYSVEIKSTAPRSIRQEGPCETNTAIQMATQLNHCKEKMKNFKQEETEKKKQYVDTCKHTEPNVTTYVKSTSPDTLTTPIQIESNEGDISRYYLKTQPEMKSKNITLKLLLPMCLDTFRTAASKSGIEDTVTRRSLEIFMSDTVLQLIESELNTKFTEFRHRNSKECEKLSLNRGIPRIRRI